MRDAPKEGWFVDSSGERRRDRRSSPTPILSRHSFFGGKRTGGQPGKDTRSFVDIYSLRGWILLTLFLVLNLLDAHFTLIYLQRGGAEANPVAAWLLDAGMGTFFFIKSLGISLGAILFCVLKNFPNARVGVLAALLLYQVLLFYHFALYGNFFGAMLQS